MTAIVRTRELVRRFGSAVVLDGIDLDIAQGQRVALSGPSGSGRTTLLQILGSLRPPSSGVVEIAGIDAGRFPCEARAFTMYVGRDLPASTALRVAEYLDFVRHARGTSVSGTERISTLAALRRAELPADVSINRLSIAMRKRLALTAALVVGPPVLLLDEPFESLDGGERSRFLDWLIETRSIGITIVAAINSWVDRGALCDTVLRMRHGRIVSAAGADRRAHDAGIQTAGTL